MRSLVNEGAGNYGAHSDGTVSPPSDSSEVQMTNVDKDDLQDVEAEVKSIGDKEATLQVPWRWSRCCVLVCWGHAVLVRLGHAGAVSGICNAVRDAVKVE